MSALDRRFSADLTVIVPAAGVGARAGGDRPKQYQLLGNDYLLDVTLDRLSLALPSASVYVALHPGDQWWQSSRSALNPQIQACTGGSTRAESVRAGLSAMSARGDDPVLVHDVARPCVTAIDIHRLIGEVADVQAGGLLAAPITDTVKEVDDAGRVVATRDRQYLWRALTPQLFPYGVLCRALDQARDRAIDVTDEASAVEALGLSPRVIRGRADNIKVTHEGDLAFAAWILQQHDQQLESGA
ncbi:2-C-methyl-D-erythritol 4-phosphate cytidylyltransferase [Halospina denitrificans]|uniref:2-C-methyl-D-erythritol 4-phosphate cytidylyltransferase n=1 Tax=Halospina denitrificans TaxID=332522 RepID=A0A4R7JXB6_9GAMM|nr:2-C-methyl-D-erythritol 4-phosphate cytidylyltransferase [Halospina denitrificans]TDT43102.1 2-C-methyl-D-erythritol 4-phosphate cytidylyltransferase [Halospina denitrificans]